jgi:hypothetical protein
MKLDIVAAARARAKGQQNLSGALLSLCGKFDAEITSGARIVESA